tara:strand:+ start:114 stop:551 length:438 start_codon:yes stop_codon:yes gene_type:complete
MIFKKTILSIIFFCSSFAFSQQFDKEFLESLPDEVKEDLLSQVEDQNKIKKEQYRRPSTLIEKPEVESDRFGVNIFSMMQSTLMPINEPNFDADYILDFGDMIQLQLVGSKSSITNIPVERDGSINIPEIVKLLYQACLLKMQQI